jgi:ABC-type hemin transport system substrate-binding protein
MAKSNQISSITNLAKKIVEKELVNGEASSAEILETLNAVAKMLETKAGGNQEITELSKQVQAIVLAKVTT